MRDWTLFVIAQAAERCRERKAPSAQGDRHDAWSLADDLRTEADAGYTGALVAWVKALGSCD